MPIPLFIHRDDIEFGLRNAKYGITFLNGVGVWHQGIRVSRLMLIDYYDTRNTLIELAINKEKGKKESLCGGFKIIVSSGGSFDL